MPSSRTMVAAMWMCSLPDRDVPWRTAIHRTGSLPDASVKPRRSIAPRAIAPHCSSVSSRSPTGSDSDICQTWPWPRPEPGSVPVSCPVPGRAPWPTLWRCGAPTAGMPWLDPHGVHLAPEGQHLVPAERHPEGEVPERRRRGDEAGHLVLVVPPRPEQVLNERGQVGPAGDLRDHLPTAASPIATTTNAASRTAATASVISEGRAPGLAPTSTSSFSARRMTRSAREISVAQYAPLRYGLGALKGCGGHVPGHADPSPLRSEGQLRQLGVAREECHPVAAWPVQRARPSRRASAHGAGPSLPLRRRVWARRPALGALGPGGLVGAHVNTMSPLRT